MATATRDAPASFTSVTMTRAPLSAIARAMPSPMPDPAPVTSASLPSSNILAHQIVGDGAAGRGSPAIHDILRAGDVRREAGGQEDHKVGDFLGCAVATDRDVR